MLYDHNNRKYKKIMFRIYTEAEFLIFMSVSIVMIMAIKCIVYTYESFEIYFHAHSRNNKLFPVLPFGILFHVYYLFNVKSSPQRYTINIAWMALFEKNE